MASENLHAEYPAAIDEGSGDNVTISVAVQGEPRLSLTVPTSGTAGTVQQQISASLQKDAADTELMLAGRVITNLEQ